MNVSLLAGPMRGGIAAASLLTLLALPAAAAMEFDAARLNEIAARLPPKPAGFGRPISDRAAWDKFSHAAAFGRVVSRAQSLAREPVPALPDDLYLDYSRTGNRDRCQQVTEERSERITTFTLAECLENQGRFLGPLTDTISAICRERTWVYPAHDGKLDNFYGRTVEMDLRATLLAWELASADYLLGERLAPETRGLLRANVERRVLGPFRDMVEGRRGEIYWLRVENNWNAVCLSGVTGAALALEESPQERARFVAAAQHYLRFLLRSFTPDGYCAEGVGYWNYGFGHFLMLGEAVRQASGGAIDLLADPAAMQPALFCTRAEIVAGIYPTISDCDPGDRPGPQWVRFIRERFGAGTPGGRAAELARPREGLAETMLFAFLPSPLPAVPHAAITPESPLRTWFKDGGVLICRPAPGSATPFAAVLKGGHNAEPHNHNDVGSFSVVAGKAMVICDPGAEIYTARTFSAHRYDSKVLNSYGHAVPVVGGQLQRPGAEARAVVLRSDFTDGEDTLALDIRSAYTAPGLERLERTFVFRRTGTPGLSVRDEVAFSEAKSFETALITWGDWKRLSEKEWVISDDGGAVRVRIDTGGIPFGMRWEKLDEDVPTPKKPMRLGIALDSPVKAATVTLTIQPETSPLPASKSGSSAK